MAAERFLLDTFFVQALLNERDSYHKQALDILPRVQAAAEVWVTEAVLVEVGNALSAFDRSLAAQFIRQCYHTANMRVMTVDTTPLLKALELYEARNDKTWGLLTAFHSLRCSSKP
jgi:predicted nucleic acid-binding protein